MLRRWPVPKMRHVRQTSRKLLLSRTQHVTNHLVANKRQFICLGLTSRHLSKHLQLIIESGENENIPKPNGCGSITVS